MKNVIFYLIFAYWFLLALKDWFWIFIFIPIFALYFYLRFRKKGILILWIFLCFWALFLTTPHSSKPKNGLYTIVQIKSNYVIAKKGHSQILLYGIENPNFFEVYKVKNIDEITELKNLNQFSFSEYLSKDRIEYCSTVSDQQLVKSSHSIKARLYSLLKDNSLLCANLYGIQNDSSNILIQLGLPIISTYYVLYRFLQRKWDEKRVHFILLVLIMIYGYFFVYTVALVRFICFQIAKLFFKSWQGIMSFSLFLFLSLLPLHALDFSFVFPVFYHLLFYYIPSTKKRWIAQKLLLITCQFVYFHEVDLFTFLFFSILRKFQFIQFIASIFNVSFPFFTDLIGKWTFHYVPGLLFFFILFLFLIKKNKFFFVLLCLCPFFECKIDPFFHVYMINIGQGDCTLIVEPFRQSAVMIDCGQNLYRDNVEQIIVPVLEDLQIHKLTALICTHDDYDHSGGKDELVEKIEVEQVITSRNDTLSVNYPFQSLLIEREAKDANDSSIINYFSYDNVNYLWMGDASIEVEEQLLDTYELDVDILKLGHHGSKTSSSYDFLDQLRPKLGLISVGKNNRYGHPSTSVVANCHDLGIETLQTKDVGMIHIFSFHEFVYFETATHLIGRIS